MALLDVNLDGNVDLAVGASSYGDSGPLDYNVCIDILYLGEFFYRLCLFPKPRIELSRNLT